MDDRGDVYFPHRLTRRAVCKFGFTVGEYANVVSHRNGFSAVFPCGGLRVALAKKVWQSAAVRIRLFQRCFFFLGMMAMLGALVAVPLTATYALAMSGKTTAMAMEPAHHMDMSATKAPMPCDGPVKHCPDCPQKVCPDMGSCLVKCFQTLSPLAVAQFYGEITRDRVAPGDAVVTVGSLIPPLLRPPSV